MSHPTWIVLRENKAYEANIRPMGGAAGVAMPAKHIGKRAIVVILG